jgi:elongator complex protein 3
MRRISNIWASGLRTGAESSEGEAQHIGLGTGLIEEAMRIAGDAGFNRISALSAIWTREYYRKLGFGLGELYMTREN